MISFSSKKSTIFNLTSLISLVAMLLCLSLIVVNFSGVTFERQTEYEPWEYEVTYTDEQTVEGAAITPLKIDVIFDCSETGWRALQNDDLLEHLNASLIKFADESHVIEYDGYYDVFAQGSEEKSKSTGSFLEIQSDEEAELWRAIDKFKTYFDRPEGDVAYQVLIENGIENLLTSAASDSKKILVLLIGSPDLKHNLLNDETISQLRASLEENDISLYAVGVLDSQKDYSKYYGTKEEDYLRLEKLTDYVYRDVLASDIDSVITDLFEREAYSVLSSNDGGAVAEVRVPAPAIDREIREVSINMTSTDEFLYSIEKLTTLEDNRESITAISDGTGDESSVVVPLNDIDIEGISGELVYRIRFQPVNDQMVFYSVNYTTAEIVEPAPKVIEVSLFEAMNWNNDGVGYEFFIYGLGACSMLVFALSILDGMLKKSRYMNYAKRNAR